MYGKGTLLRGRRIDLSGAALTSGYCFFARQDRYGSVVSCGFNFRFARFDANGC